MAENAFNGGYFEDFVAQGEKKAKAKGSERKPFVIKFKDDTPDIRIEPLDALKSLHYEQAQSGLAQLRVIMRPGDLARFMEKLDGAPVEALKAIVDDIWDKWNDDSNEVPGGKADSEV